jgi:voltage-gated potassium channel
VSYTALRRRVYEVLEKARERDILSSLFDGFIVAVILANMLAVVLESFAALSSRYAGIFYWFEVGSVAVFSAEYLLRLWTCDFLRPHSKKLAALLLFIVSPIGLIDVAAVMPFYLPLLIPIDLRFVRMLRLVRFLRLFKLSRYARSVAMVGKVLTERRDELMVAVLLSGILLLVAATMMFYIESSIQPDAFPNILATMWWAVATLTTIGYGDVFPLTGWGRLLSGIIAILGIGLVALPTGIISGGFIEELTRRRRQREEGPGAPAAPAPLPSADVCPHCGASLADLHQRHDKDHGDDEL